jgi:hypothetical protein
MISFVATLSVKKVAVTTSGIMILTLNSSGSFSLAMRGHCAPPRRCARRTKFDLETSRERTMDRVETWTWQQLSSCNFAWQRQGETVLYCPYVHSTLTFENKQITENGVSMEEAGNCVFSACRTIISSWRYQAIDVM